MFTKTTETRTTKTTVIRADDQPQEVREVKTVTTTYAPIAAAAEKLEVVDRDLNLGAWIKKPLYVGEHEVSLNHGRSFASGNKKAVLIGINYVGTDHELKGCIQDAKHVQDFLISHRGYTDTPETMKFLSDEATSDDLKPTTKNILTAFEWLTSNNQPGDQLFLHYSGHGAVMKQASHPNGQEDCLVPLDYKTAGCIDADAIHRALYHVLPPTVKLSVIFDCCHSGTMLELPWTYRPSEDGTLNKKEVDSKGFKREHFTSETEGETVDKPVVVISGCRDDQTSADTVIKGYGSTGALSYAVQSVLKEQGPVTYDGLLRHIREFMATNNLTQVPQLSCGMEIDPTGTFEF
ncbi:hypothetical protein HDU99_005529 [Rhizoclosmatium hyalinum]|nr:hypothetical protein HDU99_005529 [Rhizoclosmatium hyalinum]